MRSKQQNILLWVLLLSGISVAMLYIPNGRNDDFLMDQYYSTSGVDFKNQFQNVRSKSSMGNYAQSASSMGLNTSSLPNSAKFESVNLHDVSIETASPEASSTTVNNVRPSTYKVSASQSSEISSGANYSVQSYSTNAEPHIESAGSIAGIVEQSTFFVKHNSDKNDRNGTLDAVASINLDMEVFSDLNTKQGLGAGTNDITDPGEDPTGPPIPVSDGTWVLITLVVAYLCWKSYRISKLAKAN